MGKEGCLYGKKYSINLFISTLNSVTIDYYRDTLWGEKLAYDMWFKMHILFKPLPVLIYLFIYLLFLFVYLFFYSYSELSDIGLLSREAM